MFCKTWKLLIQTLVCASGQSRGAKDFGDDCRLLDQGNEAQDTVAADAYNVNAEGSAQPFGR